MGGPRSRLGASLCELVSDVERCNEEWTSDLGETLTGLYKCVLTSTQAENLKPFIGSTGTFIDNGQHDAYFVIKQVIMANLAAFSKEWHLTEDELQTALRVALGARNAQAHNDRDPQEVLCGKKIHNKATVKHLHDQLHKLLSAAVQYGQTPEAKEEANTALCWLNSKFSLFEERQKEFRGRVVEKLAAIKQNELKVKLVHMIPHTDKRWDDLEDDVQKLLRRV